MAKKDRPPVDVYKEKLKKTYKKSRESVKKGAVQTKQQYRRVAKRTKEVAHQGSVRVQEGATKVRRHFDPKKESMKLEEWQQYARRIYIYLAIAALLLIVALVILAQKF